MKAREKRVIKGIPKAVYPNTEGWLWCEVIIPFDGHRVGSIIHLNERRYKSLSNRNKVRAI